MVAQAPAGRSVPRVDARGHGMVLFWSASAPLVALLLDLLTVRRQPEGEADAGGADDAGGLASDAAALASRPGAPALDLPTAPARQPTAHRRHTRGPGRAARPCVIHRG